MRFKLNYDYKISIAHPSFEIIQKSKKKSREFVLDQKA